MRNDPLFAPVLGVKCGLFVRFLAAESAYAVWGLLDDSGLFGIILIGFLVCQPFLVDIFDGRRVIREIVNIKRLTGLDVVIIGVVMLGYFFALAG